MQILKLFSGRSLTVAAMLLLSSVAYAQQLMPPQVKINQQRFTKLDKDYLQRAVSLRGSASKPKEWGVFDVEFATLNPWLDSVTITYTVIMQQDPKLVTPGDKALSLFKTVVEYPLVQKGSDHRAGVVMPPNALERYGKPIGYAVQISVGGSDVASYGVGRGILQAKQNWWTDSNIMDSPNLARRDGFLVDRMKSPFQLVDVDSYEVSR